MTAVIFTSIILATLMGATSTSTQPVEVKSDVLRFVVDPQQGGTITELSFRDNPRVNFSSGGGLIQEGFGVGSFYAPNRRVHETLEINNDDPDRTVLRFTYDCEGPGINGLRVVRTMEPVPEEASIRVTWKLVHFGIESLWVTPWVRHDVAPGGSVDAADVITLPTLDGIRAIETPQWAAASRNWAAVTDAQVKESVVAVYSAEDMYATLALPYSEKADAALGIQSAFVPFLMEPGDSWETNYRINLVRGLERVDFATQEIAGWIGPSAKWFYGYYTSVRPIANISLRSTLTDPELYRLPNQLFSLKPGTVVQCLFPDMPRDLMEKPLAYSAEFLQNGSPMKLNSELDGPKDAIHAVIPNESDLQDIMEPWTDAVRTLARKPRETALVPALEKGLPAWWASSLEKVFREDTPVSSGSVRGAYEIKLARNEGESAQLVLQHPGVTSRPVVVQLALSEFKHESSGDRLPEDAVSLYHVDYARVDVPTHFESLTGHYPDRLTPTNSVTVTPGKIQPVWLTVRTKGNTRPGLYTGSITLNWVGGRRAEVELKVRVLDFELPPVPSMKSDIGIDPESTWTAARKQYRSFPNKETFNGQLRDLAEQYRVTFSGLSSLMVDPDNPDASLQKAKARLRNDARSGVSTYAVSPMLLENPKALKKLDAFVSENNLEGKVFAHVARDPRQDKWEDGVAQVQAWNKAAPHIPSLVTTQGLHPFLAADAGIWALHTQVIDTGNLGAIQEAMQQGKEMWLYVDHGPGRPYANLVTDMEMVDHRMLFWQAWALGAKGFHYGNGADWARDSHADVTPANGFGLLIYPYENGPVSSLRFEAIRDGIEDYDYLVMLIERLNLASKRPELAGVVTDIKSRTDLGEIMQGMTEYTRDPVKLAAKRQMIGDAIVALDLVLAK